MKKCLVQELGHFLRRRATANFLFKTASHLVTPATGVGLEHVKSFDVFSQRFFIHKKTLWNSSSYATERNGFLWCL